MYSGVLPLARSRGIARKTDHDPVYITSCREEVHYIARKDDAVFLADDGKPLTMRGVSRLFDRLRERTGIDDKRVSPHQCRRYMATMQLAAGRSPLDVQRQMGHTTLTMTNHYASLSVDQLKRSHEMYSPLRAKQEGVNKQGLGTGYWEAE